MFIHLLVICFLFESVSFAQNVRFFSPVNRNILVPVGGVVSLLPNNGYGNWNSAPVMYENNQNLICAFCQSLFGKYSPTCANYCIVGNQFLRTLPPQQITPVIGLRQVLVPVQTVKVYPYRWNRLY
ncbi:uncharacterized protein LOC133196445 [Saccostrea echinata]|uniref:uncharacterized protein LOC133196445 n=1 Tax=Saccostrea echinata TaxID=191078 RepID=UPI002A835D83|nr:uncharacterized protein LOC133196445 [Saccostrea echinata]